MSLRAGGVKHQVLELQLELSFFGSHNVVLFYDQVTNLHIITDFPLENIVE